MNKFYDSGEVLRELQIAPAQLQNYINQGMLKPVSQQEETVFHQNDIEEFKKRIVSNPTVYMNKSATEVSMAVESELDKLYSYLNANHCLAAILHEYLQNAAEAHWQSEEPLAMPSEIQVPEELQQDAPQESPKEDMQPKTSQKLDTRLLSKPDNTRTRMFSNEDQAALIEAVQRAAQTSQQKSHEKQMEEESLEIEEAKEYEQDLSSKIEASKEHEQDLQEELQSDADCLEVVETLQVPGEDEDLGKPPELNKSRIMQRAETIIQRAESRFQNTERRSQIAEAVQKITSEGLLSDAEFLSADSSIIDESSIIDSEHLQASVYSDDTPEEIDDYKILDKIFHRGMKIIYRIQTPQGKLMALKILPRLKATRHENFIDNTIAKSADEDKIPQMFAHGALANGKPQLNQYLDSGIYRDEAPYLVMELFEGQSLTECISREISLKEIMRVFRTICEIVKYAHSQNILHLGLKPSNIFITQKNRVVITDFGVAQYLDVASAIKDMEYNLTKSCYMAPEQLESKDVACTTDIYALGLLLYELLTGKNPFRTGDFGDTYKNILFFKPAPPSSLHSAIPSSLDKICQKCLNKNPATRYSSMSQLMEDISRIKAYFWKKLQKPLMGTPQLSKLDMNYDTRMEKLLTLLDNNKLTIEEFDKQKKQLL